MPVAFHPPLEHPREPPPAARGNDDGANADLFAALLSGAAAAADAGSAPQAAGPRHGSAHDDDPPTATVDVLAAFAAAAGISLGLVAGHANAAEAPVPAIAGDDGRRDGATHVDTAHAAHPGIAAPADARTTSPPDTPSLAVDPATARVPHAAPARPPATPRGATKPALHDATAAIDLHAPGAEAKVSAALPNPLVQAAALLARAGDAAKSLEASNASKAADDAPGIAGNAPAPSPPAPPPIVRTIAEAVGTPGFAPALAQQMAQLVRVNAERAELHLHPAEMGPIDVRLHVQHNQVTVTMVAADAQARDAMQQALPQLREALAREGLALADASVQDQPRRDPGSPPSPPRAPRDGELAVRGVDAAADVASIVRARRLVDLYA